jgi:5'-nucleotidase
MVSATGADCALLNGGGIRASIDAGEITVGEIINVLPFGNYVITKRVTGADIKAALEHGTSAYPELAGGFPHVSGMRFVMDLTREPGSRVVDIFINGQPLDLDKQYILATVDFLAAGGDPCTMLKDAPVVGEYGTLDEIVRGYIQAAGTVNPAVEGRITVRGAAGEVSHLESN